MWRLIFAILLFLISLLVFFKAPTNFFWKVAVAVTEFPYIFIGISLIFFIFNLWSQSYKLPILIITGISFLFYLRPIVNAYSVGQKLEQNFSENFPSQALKSPMLQPYSFLKMFSGIGIQEVSPHILTYKQLPERDLDIDFYSAQTKSLAPCVIVIHGGSWAAGDSKQLPDLNSYLSNRGYHVAAINYRLAPKYKFPAPIEDTKAVINYLVANADKLQIDTTNLVLLGRSAGAQIALVAAYSFNDSRIKGVVSIYGPADMAWGARIKSNKLVLNTDQVFTDYLGGLIDEIPEQYKASTSIEYITKNSTPTLIIHGEKDALVSYGHSERLNKKLNEVNVKHYFLSLPLATHGCDYNINGPSGQLSTFAIERFINSVTLQ